MVDFFVRRRGRMNGKGGERDVEEDTKRSDYLTLPCSGQRNRRAHYHQLPKMTLADASIVVVI